MQWLLAIITDYYGKGDFELSIPVIEFHISDSVLPFAFI